MNNPEAVGVVAEAIHKIERAVDDCKRIEQDATKNDLDRLLARSRVYEAERAFGAQWRVVKEVLARREDN